MKTIFIFLGTLTLLIFLAELGQNYTHFNKAGDFIVVFFYCTIISSIITGCNYFWTNKIDDNRVEREIELTNSKTREIEAKSKFIEVENKYNFNDKRRNIY